MNLEWHDEPRPADAHAVERLVAATQFFTPAEVAIARELVEARLQHVEASGYHFVFGSQDDRLAAYACFGPIAGTEASFDLYWIAVSPEHQNRGVGAAVLARAEQAMRRLGATRYYAETSSTARYAPTRAFYLARGLREVARIADFYRPGDGKVIYERLITP